MQQNSIEATDSLSLCAMGDEEKTPLLKPGNDDDVYRDNTNGDSLYYDSFPSIGSPSPAFPIQGDTDVIEDKDAPIQNILANTQIKVYKRRWYILVMFSLFSNAQNAIWNTWGPISNSAERVFGWDDSTIAWLNNWGPISFILSGMFFPWLLQAKGLRWAVLSSTLLVSLGCTCRVITSHPSTASILIHIGQFLNGLGGPIGMGAIPHISASWFPVHERITATAISTSISVFGSAITFVLGPTLVSDGMKTNNTTNHTQGLWTPDFTENKHDIDHIIEKERQEIMYYMYYSCGWSWLLTIIILIYYPSKPPFPPCVSAVVRRDKYWKGMWSLRKKGSFLLIAFIYGISLGVINVWSSVLNVNLRTVKISETTAGWLGFYGVIAQCAVSLLIGRFADYFSRMMKMFILVLYIVGAGAFIVFSLMLGEFIPFSTVLMYVTVIAGMTLINGAVPLMYELACELAFPTSEGSANGVLTYFNNVAGLIFLAIFAIPHIGKMWMNWAAVGSVAVCIPMICLLKDKMNRLEVDEAFHSEKIINQEVVVESDEEHLSS